MRRSDARVVMCSALGFAAAPATASADIVANWVLVSISAAARANDPVLNDMQTWDLMLTTDGDWNFAVLRATLPAGMHFYKHWVGGNTRPHPSIVSAFPALAYDTYVAAPSDTGSNGATNVLGGIPEGQPASLGGASSAIPGTISVTWSDQVTDAPGSYQVARLTFPRSVTPSVRPGSYTSQLNPNSILSLSVQPPVHNRWANDADGEWQVASNWSLGHPPNAGEDAFIDVGSAAVRTITHGQGDDEVQSLFAREHVVLSGGRLMVRYGSNFQNGLTLSGAGTLRLDEPQSLVAGSGGVHFAGGGRLEVRRGTQLTVALDTVARGWGGTIGSWTAGTTGAATLLVQGRVSANAPGAVLSIDVDRVVNKGTLEARNGAVLSIRAGSGWSTNQVLAHASGDVVEITTIDGFDATAPVGNSIVGGDGAVRVTGWLFANDMKKIGNGPLRVTGRLGLAPNDYDKIDFAGGSMVHDYAPGPSSLNAVRSLIVRGYNGGAWDGTGINSSTAAANAGLALGYAEATALFTSFPATFAGEPIDESTLLVRLVRYGDANLDGAVNLQDFNRLVANFGAHFSPVWSDSDFNYDGTINLQDFNLLAANFGQSAAGSTVTSGDWSALASAVPEPDVAGLVVLSGLLPGARRRRG